MALPLSRPSLRRQDFDQVLDAMVHDRLTGGEINRNLCKEINRTLGLKSSSVFASVSDAVRQILVGLGLEAGDRVVLSPLAPPYWLSGLERLGIQPLFADVLAASPVLDPDSVAALSSQGPKAVIADCSLGYLPESQRFAGLGLLVIEDISQGMGGQLEGRACGTVGDAVLAHFSPESLVAGAGGCLAGFRQSLADDRAISNWETLSDLGAALILSQWQDLQVFAEKKRENLRRLFVKTRGYSPPKQTGDADLVLPWFPLLVDQGAKDILAYARKHAVEADWAFRNQPHLNPDSSQEFCPHARSFLFRTLIFPLYATISERDIADLGKVLSSLP